LNERFHRGKKPQEPVSEENQSEMKGRMRLFGAASLLKHAFFEWCSGLSMMVNFFAPG
jgi:hypothetical protein